MRQADKTFYRTIGEELPKLTTSLSLLAPGLGAIEERTGGATPTAIYGLARGQLAQKILQDTNRAAVKKSVLSSFAENASKAIEYARKA